MNTRAVLSQHGHPETKTGRLIKDLCQHIEQVEAANRKLKYEKKMMLAIYQATRRAE